MYLSRIHLTGDLTMEPKLAGFLRKGSYGIHQLLWELFDDGSRHLFREENSQEQLDTRKRLPLYYVLSEQQPKQDSTLFTVESKPYSPKLMEGDKLVFKLRANPTVSRRVQGKKNSIRHDVVMDSKYQHILEACLKAGVLHKDDIYTKDPSNKTVFKQKHTKKELQEKLFKKDTFADIDTKKQFFDQQEQRIETDTQNWLINRGEQHGFKVETVQATGYQWHKLIKTGSHKNSGFSSMNYEGVLTVGNVSEFLKMLNHGLGPSKGLGCGLMLIHRY